MPENVRCKDCGYLGVVNRETGLTEEANFDFREHRIIPSSVLGIQRNRHEEIPLCYQNICDFRREASSGSKEDVVAAMARDRLCDRFIKLRPGKNPREHEDMDVVARVTEQSRRAIEDQKRERAVERAEDLSRAAQWRAEDQATTASRFRKQEFRYWISVAISILAFAISAVVAAYNYPR
jgi:hypothetical protein